ncbi:hypothetical protein [Chryseobacterium sp. MA9]|uniref:hypothetical protein n=1 Tax=Chryseobacterium sp. MA9 TaxID=2966625 RepID=UPI002102702A|nr:hypothetical protein [Chryseobacterium sp. MA9]UTX49651.1 hypothetical protein KIK00_05130 [Chryseobacterium sp. MA9]
MEGECRRAMQKGIMVEVQDIMHLARLRKCIFMTIVAIITEAVVMDITDKKESTDFFSAFLL